MLSRIKSPFIDFPVSGFTSSIVESLEISVTLTLSSKEPSLFAFGTGFSSAITGLDAFKTSRFVQFVIESGGKHMSYS